MWNVSWRHVSLYIFVSPLNLSSIAADGGSPGNITLKGDGPFALFVYVLYG